MKRMRLLPLVATLFAGGCFPIDLDVNAKGELLIPRQEGFFLYQPRTGEVRKVAGAGGGTPVFARFSPAGDEALLVVKVRHDFSTEFRFDLVPLKGGKARTMFRTTTREPGNVHFSPDGSQVAI